MSNVKSRAASGSSQRCSAFRTTAKQIAASTRLGASQWIMLIENQDHHPSGRDMAALLFTPTAREFDRPARCAHRAPAGVPTHVPEDRRTSGTEATNTIA